MKKYSHHVVIKVTWSMHTHTIDTTCKTIEIVQQTEGTGAKNNFQFPTSSFSQMKLTDHCIKSFSTYISGTGTPADVSSLLEAVEAEGTLPRYAMKSCCL